jgi:CRP/FNR family transcriptional regulator, cyclic AMP receptor protein
MTRSAAQRGRSAAVTVADRGSLCRLDRSLAEELSGTRLAAAERDLVAALEHLPPGNWQPDPDEFRARGGIGLLIVEGFMVRRVEIAHRAAGELLGPGDLLRPWQDDGGHAVYPFAAAWRVLDPMVVAVLDRGFTTRLGPYPEVTGALTGRAMARSRRVTGQLALAQFGSVRNRLLLALWHLADDWGRVRLDGIVVPISLTHEMLGLLIGARRPVVTAALGELAADGLVVQDGQGFRLLGEPPADLELLRGARR